MAASGASPFEMLSQLDQARKLALGDPTVYNQIVPGILPIIGLTAPVEIRRWGAEFIAEAFASPSLPSQQKELLTSDVLPTLKSMLDTPNEDPSVIKSVVQASASIYPLVFRRVISHPDQAPLWHDMNSMKISIVQRMDSMPAHVKICCIKFLQKVVQVQTPGVITDPRRTEQNETSIALVPRNHPLLPLTSLEAETSGLLDRLLSVLQENSGDPVMVDATMNCLAVLVRTRPVIANKILSTILSYNPLKQATTPMTPRTMVVVKSLERTTRAFLRFILRSMPNHPLEPKIQSYLMRLQQSRTALLSESHSLKRPAEASDGNDDAKRQRLAPRQYPPLGPPPYSFAQLFTLTEDPSLQQFDVKVLPADMVSMIASALMQHVDSKSLDEAVEEIRQRRQYIEKLAPPAPGSTVPLAGPTGIDDEDEYDPEALGGGDESLALSTEKAVEELAAQPMLDLGPYELPKPPPLAEHEVIILSNQTVNHIFEAALTAERSQAPVRPKAGLNRLAASSNDREAWLTMMIRLATRAPSGIEEVVASRLSEGEDGERFKRETEALQSSEQPNVANRIRDILFHYVLDDWKHRLSVAIAWLTEEWYADKIQAFARVDSKNSIATSSTPTVKASLDLPNYDRWVTRLFAQLVPRFDQNDHKILIRFLSEIPSINQDVLDYVKQLARDPLNMKMCILALQYLFMMRPPVREIVVDTMEAIWLDGDKDVKANTGKVLNKWRPGFADRLSSQKTGTPVSSSTAPATNGFKTEPAVLQGRPESASSTPQPMTT